MLPYSADRIPFLTRFDSIPSLQRALLLFASVWLFFGLVFTAPLCSAQGAAAQKSGPAESHIILILDNSGSMRRNDPNYAIRTAVSDFAGKLPQNTKLAIVLFDTNAETILGLTPVTSSNFQGLLQNALNQINYQGQLTDIPGGIERGLSELERNSRPGTDSALIFLTDGIVDLGSKSRNSERTRYLEETLLPEIKSEGIRVHGVALTKAADLQLVQNLSQETHGEYQTVLGAQDISSAFQKINHRLQIPSAAENVPPRASLNKPPAKEASETSIAQTEASKTESPDESVHEEPAATSPEEQALTEPEPTIETPPAVALPQRLKERAATEPRLTIEAPPAAALQQSPEQQAATETEPTIEAPSSAASQQSPEEQAETAPEPTTDAPPAETSQQSPEQQSATEPSIDAPSDEISEQSPQAQTATEPETTLEAPPAEASPQSPPPTQAIPAPAVNPAQNQIGQIETTESPAVLILWILIGLLTLVLIIVLWLLLKRNSQQTTEPAEKAAEEESIEAVLVDISTDSDNEITYTLGEGALRIGRAQRINDIVIDQSTVSSEHAIIEQRNGKYYLRDLNSTNGTFINDRKVGKGGLPSEVCLNDHDLISIARYKFRFRCEEVPVLNPSPVPAERTLMTPTVLIPPAALAEREKSLEETIAGNQYSRCPNHPDVVSNEMCAVCMRAFCDQCVAEKDGHLLCEECLSLLP